jgi:hypothetical protein
MPCMRLDYDQEWKLLSVYELWEHVGVLLNGRWSLVVGRRLSDDEVTTDDESSIRRDRFRIVDGLRRSRV